jgi:hypothetical protein
MGRLNPEEAYRPGSTGFNVAAICDCLFAVKGYMATEDVQAAAAVILDPLPPLTSIAAGCTDWRRRTGNKANRPPMLVRNGQKHPRAGTVGNAIWEWADKLAAEGLSYSLLREKMMAEAKSNDFVVTNVSTELSAWHRFHKEI